jgi:F0F1-type ATP synthase membrane subunit b/b'
LKTHTLLRRRLQPAAICQPSFSSSADTGNEQKQQQQSQPKAQTPGTQNFFQNIVSNIKKEMAMNKDLEENRKRLREELDRMKDTEELRQARKKFVR